MCCLGPLTEMFCLGHPNGHAPQGGKNYYDSETRAQESVQGGDYEGTVQYHSIDSVARKVKTFYHTS